MKELSPIHNFNPSGEIIHIKNFEQGSDLGLSPIEAGSEAIGSALAQDEFAGILQNGAVYLVSLKWIQLLRGTIKNF